MLDEIDGDTVSVITTAFWGGDDGMYSNNNFEDFIKNDCFLIESQAKDIETAIIEWKEYYEMSKSQINLLPPSLKEKISNLNGEIILTVREIRMIESDDEGGINESTISFEELGLA